MNPYQQLGFLRSRVWISCLALTISCTWTATHSARPAPSSASTRTRIIKLIDRLDRDPFGPEAAQLRARLEKEIQKAPDLHVAVCTLAWERHKGRGDDWIRLLQTQRRLSMARFLIESEEWARQDDNLFVAGIEGVLVLYRKLKRWDSSVYEHELEVLLDLERRGLLMESLHRTPPACVD